MKYPIQNKAVALLVLIAYYVLVTIPHEVFGRYINGKFDEVFSKAQYDRFVLIVVMVVMVSVLLISYKRWIKHDRRILWLTCFLVNCVLVFMSMYYLFIINIEVIHFLQYCLFAILCYGVTKNYYSILTWAILAGALDELHQYLILNPEGTNYFDFNDVIINTIGALFGILFLNLFGFESKKIALSDRWKSPLFITLYVLVVAVIISFVTGYSAYSPTEEAKFVVFKQMPEDFWTWVNKHIVFHIVRPWEYVLITAALYIGYSPILRADKTEETKAS